MKAALSLTRLKVILCLVIIISGIVMLVTSAASANPNIPSANLNYCGTGKIDTLISGNDLIRTVFQYEYWIDTSEPYRNYHVYKDYYMYWITNTYVPVIMTNYLDTRTKQCYS